MKKLLFCIKKFFAIIFSLIFGIFSRNNEEIKYNEEHSENINKYKRKKIVKDTNNDTLEDKSLFNKSSEQYSVIYNAKNDIQKVITIQKNIIQLEYEINSCTDIKDIYILKGKLEKEKNCFEKIADYYSNVNLEHKIIKEIKEINANCYKLIREEEGVVNNRIYKLNKESNNNNQIIEQEENLIDNSTYKENQELVTTHKEQKVKNNLNEEKNTSFEKENTSIMETIVIKEINDIIHKVNMQETKDAKLELENKKNKVNKDGKLHETQENIRIIKVEKNSNSDNEIKKIEHINKEVLEQKLEKNKLSNKNKILIAIALILSKAVSIMSKINITSLLQLNSNSAINSALIVNNEIRKARSLTGKKTKKLKLDKVIKKVGNDPKNQVKAIVNNSLSEIRKLKSELKQYGMSEEVLNALNELEQLELEIIMQANELENVNQLTATRTR